MPKKSNKSAAPSTKNAERKIEEAAARGDRKLVEKLTAAEKPAPKHTALDRYLAACAKQGFKETYINSLERPLEDFLAWTVKRNIQVSTVATEELVAYRVRVQKQDRSLSTKRMDLARVSTFLKFMGCKADLKVLRLQLTDAEKDHQAEAAERRELEAEAEAKAKAKAKTPKAPKAKTPKAKKAA